MSIYDIVPIVPEPQHTEVMIIKQRGSRCPIDIVSPFILRRIIRPGLRIFFGDKRLIRHWRPNIAYIFLARWQFERLRG